MDKNILQELNKLLTFVKIMPVSFTFNINANGKGMMTIINMEYGNPNFGEVIYNGSGDIIEDLIKSATESIQNNLKNRL